MADVPEFFQWEQHCGIQLFDISLPHHEDAHIVHALKATLTARYRLLYARVDMYCPSLSLYDIFRKIRPITNMVEALQNVSRKGVICSSKFASRLSAGVEPMLSDDDQLVSDLYAREALLPNEPEIPMELLNRRFRTVGKGYSTFKPAIESYCMRAMQNLREEGPLLGVFSVAPDYTESSGIGIFRSQYSLAEILNVGVVHAVCIVGYKRDPGNGELVWIYLSSYGTGFGENGYGLMPNSYFLDLYAPGVSFERKVSSFDVNLYPRV